MVETQVSDEQRATILYPDEPRPSKISDCGPDNPIQGDAWAVEGDHASVCYERERIIPGILYRTKHEAWIAAQWRIFDNYTHDMERCKKFTRQA